MTASARPESTLVTFENFIDGAWQPARDDATFGNENPAVRGSDLGRFQSSTPGDVDAAISAASDAFVDWRRTTVTARQQYVGRFLDRLGAARDALARIVTLENGKTIRESRAEVDSALVEGTYHMHQIGSFFGQARSGGAEAITTWVEHEPLGVIGVISPWNFPMNVMCRKTLPALLTGNTVVFKPATFTPWSGVFMASLFDQVGLPPGVFNCVTGLGSSIGDAIVRDRRVRAISFTGSTPVGRRIQASAAADLTRTQLELGGKNGLIVMDDADLGAAVDAVMVAAFSNAGQWCTSTSRLLLHRSVARSFVAELVERCEEMRVGDGLLESTDMGPVAGPQQFDDVRAAIERARSDGARLVAGCDGVATNGEGYFIRPTVLVGVEPEMAAFREEIFGPVLSVTEFGSLDEALELANDSDYGLSSALFTRDLHTARRYVGEIEAGLAHVNIHTGHKDPWMPFGGTKQSGYGPPENGRSGLEFFVDQKAVYIGPDRA